MLRVLITRNALVTQLVEYLAYNEAVSGSSPLTPIDLVYAGMVELVDTLDLGSRGSNLAGSSPATRKKTPVEPTTFMASIT